MEIRELGRSGIRVGAIGLGCMGMSEFYGPRDEAESIATIHRALDLGVTFLDTADIYGPFTNEVLVGQAIQGRRDPVVLATKFGIVRSATDPLVRGISGRPGVRPACCDASLKRLGVETIDLYYQHRVDPKTPIEETVGAMAELVRAGKVRFLGLSEAGPDHAPAGRRGPPHRRSPDRVLAVEPRPGGRDPGHVPGARDRLRGLQPARPRLPDRPDQALRGPGRRTTGGDCRRDSRARTSRRTWIS